MCQFSLQEVDLWPNKLSDPALCGPIWTHYRSGLEAAFDIIFCVCVLGCVVRKMRQSLLSGGMSSPQKLRMLLEAIWQPQDAAEIRGRAPNSVTTRFPRLQVSSLLSTCHKSAALFTQTWGWPEDQMTVFLCRILIWHYSYWRRLGCRLAAVDSSAVCSKSHTSELSTSYFECETVQKCSVAKYPCTQNGKKNWVRNNGWIGDVAEVALACKLTLVTPS